MNLSLVPDVRISIVLPETLRTRHQSCPTRQSLSVCPQTGPCPRSPSRLHRHVDQDSVSSSLYIMGCFFEGESGGSPHTDLHLTRVTVWDSVYYCRRLFVCVSLGGLIKPSDYIVKVIVVLLKRGRRSNAT